MNHEYLKESLEKFDEKTTLRELQKYVNDMVEIRGFKDTPETIMLLLTEELGELAKEVRKTVGIKMDVSKKSELDVQGEIADVFIYLLSMCRIMNVNLLEAFKEKETRNMKREWK